VQRGFSLVETIIATGLIVAALVTLAQLLAIGVQAGAVARIRTTSALLAGRKMEELRARTWEAMLGDGRESVEFFDGQGSRVCGETPMPCGAAAYVCRWSAEPATFNANVLVIEVDVAAIATRAGSTTLVSARSRTR
jgi:uncharacterized protein (TIGR02598 family)